MAAMVELGHRGQPACAQADGGTRLHQLDLRRMLDVAQTIDSDIGPGRWRLRTRLRRRPWEVIVEPDAEAQLVVVITAYPLSR